MLMVHVSGKRPGIYLEPYGQGCHGIDRRRDDFVQSERVGPSSLVAKCVISEDVPTTVQSAPLGRLLVIDHSAPPQATAAVAVTPISVARRHTDERRV